MKSYIFTIFLLLALLSSSEAHANFINVLSQEYKVEWQFWGDAWLGQNSFEHVSASGIQTSSSPVSLNTSFSYGYNGALLDAFAGGDVGSQSAYVTGFGWSNCDGHIHSSANATASITFSPLTSFMRVFIWSGSNYGYISLDLHEYKLEDLTTSSTLFNYMDYGNTLNDIWQFDTTHTYKISTIAYIPDAVLLDNSSLFIASVPEPASLLLLGLGLMGLVGIRKTFRY